MECGRTFRKMVCAESGEHLCVPRAEHIRAFFAEMLVHTKGKFAGQPFILRPWQYDDIVRPLFGTAVWSDENDQYVRRYRRAWIEIARKNGKSELLAGIMLYLLVADGEESAELYGCARNRRQAALVFDVAKRMVQLSPQLTKLLKTVDHVKKIVFAKTNGLYEAIPADEDTALGSNPSGVAADEMLAWRGRGMWDALETGMGSGARLNPMMVAATTAGTTDSGFAEDMHKTMEQIAGDPDRSPHTFVYIRNTPASADPWSEETWALANPALGDFLSLESFRQAARDAQNDPEAEQAFRQFRLNQWTKATFRWMNMGEYDAANSVLWSRQDQDLSSFIGQPCYVGMDLAARQDLLAICYFFPNHSSGPSMLWRLHAPENAVRLLDHHNDGKFSRYAAAGWLQVHDGAVIDFDDVQKGVKEDGQRFKALAMDADEWGGLTELGHCAQNLHLDVERNVMAYKGNSTYMTTGIDELMIMVKKGNLNTFGNPLARFCFESAEMVPNAQDPDRLRLAKPQRDKVYRRIDAVVAATLAVSCWKRNAALAQPRSVYETRGIVVA